MSGWPAIALMITTQMAAAAWLIRLSARRWWDYLVIVVLTAALLRPTERYFTGDVSRYLPDAIWSDGSEGKDQIIYASAASTILLPLVVSAFAVYVCTQAVRALRPGDRG
jgi:hypothetical protein